MELPKHFVNASVTELEFDLYSKTAGRVSLIIINLKVIQSSATCEGRDEAI